MPIEQLEVADALARRARVEQLEAALESRPVIARAQGILMERYNVDADAAIAILKRTSSTLNIKVRAVAATLIESRQLPGATSSP